MKKLLLLVLVLIMTVAAVGCAAAPVNPSASLSSENTQATPSAANTQASTGTYQQIKPEDVKKLMDDGEKIIIVDVRTAGEYNSAHLPGAINIPVETISDKKPVELPDVNAKIILYCRTGARSAVAAKALLALGYTDVYDMGGIIDWPYDTVTESSAAPSAAVSTGGILSSFKATDLDGSAVDAAVLSRAKLTMVNVWATFCSPCIEEMPDLGKLSASYTDKGVQIIGVVADAADTNGVLIKSMVDTAKEIVGITGANYLHLLPSEDLNKQLLGQISAVPTTIFVDAGGKQVGETYVGSRSGEDWAAVIDELLNEVG